MYIHMYVGLGRTTAILAMPSTDLHAVLQCTSVYQGALDNTQ